MLDGQAIVYIVEGTEKNLTDNVNRMASILTLAVCETANATANVVRSGLMEEVAAESSAQRERPLLKDQRTNQRATLTKEHRQAQIWRP